MWVTGWAGPCVVAIDSQFKLFKILNKLIGAPQKYQEFPGSHADLPKFSVELWNIQLASA